MGCPFCGWGWGFGFIGPWGLAGFIWMILWLVIIIAAIYLIFRFIGGAIGHSHSHHRHYTYYDDIEDLKEEIRRLRREIRELKKS